MRNPYTVLGVDARSSAGDIKSAFRKLAKQHHPDAHPGDKEAERRFKEVNTAYSILSDPTRRKKFDRGELDNEGNEVRNGPRPGHGTGAGARTGGGWHRAWRSSTSSSSANRRRQEQAAEEAEDIFSEFFRATGAAGGQGAGGFHDTTRGEDLQHTMTVTFAEGMLGTKKRVTFPNARTLDVTIPPGTQDGQTLRLKGLGRPGSHGSPPGDALVTVSLIADPILKLEEGRIVAEVPVTLKEAVLGASIVVPTIDGKVSVKVPPGSNSGTTLRLKGKGLPQAGGKSRGDQLVRLTVKLPDPPDQELVHFLERWSPKNSDKPREWD
ncbi:MAG: J domain-containing protein [Alphaproteobacteria bacterium]|nr:J domain-containing protein [Alphaproteobacteria bacterium]